MQGAYATSQHLEGEEVANNYTMENYVHCYKKVRMTHTHKRRIAQRAKPSVKYSIISTCTCICLHRLLNILYTILAFL